MAQEDIAPGAARRVPARPELPAPWSLGVPLAVAALLLVVDRGAPRWYALWISGERGALEIGQFLVVLAGLAMALAALRLPRVRASRVLAGWFTLAALGCLYVAGEEVSWGQHLANWSTPAYWQAINDQGETNLHNTSVWLDQHPRSLLELGVVAGGVVLPLLMRLRPGLARRRLAVLAPPMALVPTALLAELVRLPERLSSALDRDLHVFLRASEVQELYFYLFVLLYLAAMRRRLAGPASTGARGP